MESKEESQLRYIKQLEEKIKRLEQELSFIKSQALQITSENISRYTSTFSSNDKYYNKSSGEENGY